MAIAATRMQKVVISLTTVTLAAVGSLALYVNGNARVTGTLSAVTLSGAIVSTGNARVGTLEADTVSGATLRNTANTFSVTNAGVLEALTLSGTSINNVNNTFTVTNAGVLDALTISGSTVRGVTLSGANIFMNVPSAGLGQAACFKATTGQVGYCSTTPTNGTCTCN